MKYVVSRHMNLCTTKLNLNVLHLKHTIKENVKLYSFIRNELSESI
jgi:hypothetical protein